MLLVSRLFDAKKKAVPKGRSPGRGIDPQPDSVKIRRSRDPPKKSKQKQQLVVWYYFTAFWRPQPAFFGDDPNEEKAEFGYSMGALNGTRMSCSPVATCDFTNIHMNIMKT